MQFLWIIEPKFLTVVITYDNLLQLIMPSVLSSKVFNNTKLLFGPCSDHDILLGTANSICASDAVF